MKTKIYLVFATVILLAACAPSTITTPGVIVPPSSTETPTVVSSETPSLATSVTPVSSPDPESTSSAQSISGEAEIDIEDFTFNPNTITVKVGTTVKWSNKDDTLHIVVSDNGMWGAASLNKGDDFIFTFTQAGTYLYHCSVHSSMTGTIVVSP